MKQKKYTVVSETTIKILACLAMLIDHIAVVLGSDMQNVLPFNTEWMRVVGRMAFPLFVFCLAEGWRHTKHKENYIKNMGLLALVSQIPYVLAVNPANGKDIVETVTNIHVFHISIVTGIKYLFVAVLLLVLAGYRRWKSYVPLLLALLLNCLYMKISGIWLCNPDRNIGYLLTAGLLMFEVADYVKKIWRDISQKKIRPDRNGIQEGVLMCLLLFLAVQMAANTGYDWWGLGLIAAMYIFQGNKWLQMLCGMLWGIALYGISYNNWAGAVAVIVAMAFLMLYNGQRGSGSKWFFYGFYPGHLLFVGCFNVVYLMF